MSPMKLLAKLLFSGMAAVLLAIGALAIATETHTGYARFQGVRTLLGDDAVWFGQTCLLLAALPLAVWLPRAWVGAGVCLWWVSLMVWLLGPLLLR